MVDQLVADGLVTPAVERAFRSVPRERFLPGVELERVYSADQAVLTRSAPDGMGLSSSSAPTIMATMLVDLDVQPGHRVLEIGAGMGYNAALLAALGAAVTTVDIDPDVAAEARARVPSGVEVRAGDGWEGAADKAPFDRIVVTVGVTDLAPAWRSQLADGGRLVAPLWLRPGLQVAAAFVSSGDRLVARRMVRCGFMQFRGPHAGAETSIGLDADWGGSVVSTAGVDALRTLWASLEDAGPAPAGAEGWPLRLALDDDRSFLAFTLKANPPRLRHGLYDFKAPGLAVVDGTRLLSSGDPATALSLTAYIASVAQLSLPDLEVEAVPTSSVGDFTPTWREITHRTPAFWSITRPSHVFLVRTQ